MSLSGTVRRVLSPAVAALCLGLAGAETETPEAAYERSILWYDRDLTELERQCGQSAWVYAESDTRGTMAEKVNAWNEFDKKIAKGEASAQALHGLFERALKKERSLLRKEILEACRDTVQGVCSDYAALRGRVRTLCGRVSDEIAARDYEGVCDWYVGTATNIPAWEKLKADLTARLGALEKNFRTREQMAANAAVVRTETAYYRSTWEGWLTGLEKAAKSFDASVYNRSVGEAGYKKVRGGLVSDTVSGRLENARKRLRLCIGGQDETVAVEKLQTRLIKLADLTKLDFIVTRMEDRLKSGR